MTCHCGCGESLRGRRRHARFAGTACRVRAHRAREKALQHRNRDCERRVRIANRAKVVARATPVALYTRAIACPSPAFQAFEVKNDGGQTLAVDPSSAPNNETFVEFEKVAHANESGDEGCERCGSLEAVIASLHESEAQMQEDRDLADRDVRRLRKEAHLLRRQLAEAREADPKSKVVREILDYWKEQTGHHRAKTPIDGDRANKVRRALKWGYKPAKIKQAIDGGARFPYVVDAKRVANGPKDSRYDDLETILKSERQIERLAALAEALEPVAAPVRPIAPVSNLAPGEQPIDAFLSRLDAAKPAGLNQWVAKCPAHDDRVASLSVAHGRQGVVAHCHAGCSIENIARAVGLDINDLFDQEPTRPTFAPSNEVRKPEPLAMEREVGQWRDRLQSHKRLLARLRELRGWSPRTLDTLSVGYDGERLTLPVRDGAGVLQNVLRYLPIRRGDERKLLAMKGRPRNLFPAPETLTGGEVWLFEGEPDAVTGCELGLRATALPGVNGWRVEWAERFEGLRVIVCFDADEHGRNAAQRVLPSLLDQAKEVRVVDLAPDRTDGFDVSDHVQAGGTASDLLRLANAASAVVRLGEKAA